MSCITATYQPQTEVFFKHRTAMVNKKWSNGKVWGKVFTLFVARAAVFKMILLRVARETLDVR